MLNNINFTSIGVCYFFYKEYEVALALNLMHFNILFISNFARTNIMKTGVGPKCMYT